MDNTISRNLKRLRLSKHFTQEQAAEQLGVSTQTVSRWECGSTLPDVLMLPQIATLYCVTVDELYRDTSVAYDNYAQRLASIYEASREPDDFIRADAEFKKLIKKGSCTTEDYRLYGILHQYMMLYCIQKAALYVYGGDACKKLGRYEKAFSHWDKALQIDPSFHDAKYSKGFCYEELGEFQKAYDIWCEITEELKIAGYEIEAKYPRELAEKCRGKLILT